MRPSRKHHGETAPDGNIEGNVHPSCREAADRKVRWIEEPRDTGLQSEQAGQWKLMIFESRVEPM